MAENRDVIINADATVGNHNAIIVSAHITDEIIGLADLALQGIEYEPIDVSEWKNDEACTTLSGSMREKVVYDLISGQLISVLDFVGLTRENGVERTTRRLMLEWENEDDLEIDLDDGCIILDEGIHLSKESAKVELQKSKTKITKALGVLLDDAI